MPRSIFAKPAYAELLAEHGNVPIGKENVKASDKRQNKKATDKGRLIAELRTKNAKLEQKYELL